MPKQPSIPSLKQHRRPGRKSLLIAVFAFFMTACGEDGSTGAAGTGTGGAAPVCLPAQEPLGSDPAKGESFPDIQLSTGDGEKKMTSELRCGSMLTLFSIGAGWCQPCIEETPALEAAFIELGDEGIAVVQVLFQDASANPATTLFCKNWVNQLTLTMPVYIDPVGETIDAGGMSGVPLNVVTDRDGKVVWRESGVIPSNLIETLRGLLPN